mgnify:FL=1
MGLIAKENKQHFSFQANSIKNRNVLSTFYIGWQYLKRFGNKVSFESFHKAIEKLNSHTMIEN